MRYRVCLLLMVVAAPIFSLSDQDDRFLFKDEKIAMTVIGPTPTRVPYGEKALVKKLDAVFEHAGAKLAPSPDQVVATAKLSRSARRIERREPTAEIIAEVAIDVPAATAQNLTVRDQRGRTSIVSRRQSVIVAFTVNFWRVSEGNRTAIKTIGLDAPFSEEARLRVRTTSLSLEREQAPALFYQHAFEAGLKELEAKLKPAFERRLLVIGAIVHSQRANPTDPIFVLRLRPGIFLLDGAMIEIWEAAPTGGAPTARKARLRVRHPQREPETRMVLCEAGKEDLTLLRNFKAGDAVVTSALP